MIARIVHAFTVGQCARTFVDDSIIGAVLSAFAAIVVCVAIGVITMFPDRRGRS